jgi:hypothetical protein
MKKNNLLSWFSKQNLFFGKTFYIKNILYQILPEKLVIYKIFDSNNSIVVYFIGIIFTNETNVLLNLNSMIIVFNI